MCTTTFSQRHSRRITALTLTVALFCLPFAHGITDSPPQAGPLVPLLQKSLIFGTDDRSAISDTTKYPWSATGRVLAYYGNTIHAGTGAMIADNAVLTAAHVVRDPEMGAPDFIEFVPGMNGSSEPFGRVRVASTAVPLQWSTGSDDSYDIAVLTLTEPAGQQTGALPYGFVPKIDLQGTTLQSAGYPSDLQQGSSMYMAPGVFLDAQDITMTELVDTEPGQSGSPIWQARGGTITVVAVLVGTRQTTLPTSYVRSEGISTYLNPEILNWINTAVASGQPPVVTGTTIPGLAPVGCGVGMPQAILVISLALGGCLLVRRSR